MELAGQGIVTVTRVEESETSARPGFNGGPSEVNWILQGLELNVKAKSCVRYTFNTMKISVPTRLRGENIKKVILFYFILFYFTLFYSILFSPGGRRKMVVRSAQDIYMILWG